jgi:hypothetical protein
MKKFDGMMPPTLVWAEAGKNGDPRSAAFAFHRKRRTGRIHDAVIGVRENPLVTMPD